MNKNHFCKQLCGPIKFNSNQVEWFKYLIKNHYTSSW